MVGEKETHFISLHIIKGNVLTQKFTTVCVNTSYVRSESFVIRYARCVQKDNTLFILAVRWIIKKIIERHVCSNEFKNCSK
jgi:hypothetical protein